MCKVETEQKKAVRDKSGASWSEHNGAKSSVWPIKIHISSGRACYDKVQPFPWVKGGIKGREPGHQTRPRTQRHMPPALFKMNRVEVAQNGFQHILALLWRITATTLSSWCYMITSKTPNKTNSGYTSWISFPTRNNSCCFFGSHNSILIFPLDYLTPTLNIDSNDPFCYQNKKSYHFR